VIWAAALVLTMSDLQAAQALPRSPPASQSPKDAAPESEKDAPSAVDAMNRARVTFEYGDYPQAAKLLTALVENGHFESPALRAEAYRLLGLVQFYQGHKGDAYSAFLEYLYLDPFAELDPFYVPPAAVSFFDQVKKEAEPRLAPIRAQKKAQEEARQKALAEEAERKRQRELEEERKKLADLAPSVEKHVVQHEFWVSVLPFGVGQLQNGDRTLGLTLATAELICGAASAGSALLIEESRDNASGKFGPQQYKIAQTLDVVKWVSGALFYALWAGGAIQAAIKFQPEEQLPDRLATPPGPK
jgi:hypothetical protein